MPFCMACAGRNAKEIVVTKTGMPGLDDYTCSVWCEAGPITCELVIKTIDCECGIKLLTDMMDVRGGRLIRLHRGSRTLAPSCRWKRPYIHMIES